MPKSASLTLDPDLLARLRRSGLGNFAAVAEDMRLQAILLGATIPTRIDPPPKPVKAYRLTWTGRRKYSTRESDYYSVHATPEAAMAYLKGQRGRADWVRDEFPGNGWDSPIAIREVEIIRDGVIRKAITEGGGTISYRDYFAPGADWRRKDNFQREYEQLGDYLSEVRHLKVTGEILELDMARSTATQTRHWLGVGFRRTFALG
jgi:hypothetical protein